MTPDPRTWETSCCDTRQVALHFITDNGSHGDSTLAVLSFGQKSIPRHNCIYSFRGFRILSSAHQDPWFKSRSNSCKLILQRWGNSEAQDYLTKAGYKSWSKTQVSSSQAALFPSHHHTAVQEAFPQKHPPQLQSDPHSGCPWPLMPSRPMAPALGLTTPWGQGHWSNLEDSILEDGAKARWQSLGGMNLVLFLKKGKPGHAYLFPATSRTWSSVACDTSAGIRVSLLSRTQNTVRLQHPPIYNEKESTAFFWICWEDGGGSRVSGFSHGMKRMHKMMPHGFKFHWWPIMINLNYTKY